MSTTPVLQPADTDASAPTPNVALTFVCLPSMSPEGLGETLANLRRAFPDEAVLIATPDPAPPSNLANARIISYTPSAPPRGAWVPTAADYLNAWTVSREHDPRAVLVLGPDASSVSPDTLRRMATGVLDGQDLVLPRYLVGPHDALFNSAILHPLTRSMFTHPIRFPLPIDVAVSRRMAERLATAAQRLTATGQGDGLIWPVGEASVAGYTVREVAGDHRMLPTPTADDLNALLANVAGSLFADLEAKASFWQRARLVTAPTRASAEQEPTTHNDPNPIDLVPMIESFRNAYNNLRELWSLVLPPNSLLALKKLSIAPAETFRMPDALWARTVYDFLLAYRLRTINRGHLLGALTPLYLAWVASHLQRIDGDAGRAEEHIEAVAAAFANDKPYLVARWRWPDRFNP
jgi:hypothetical protein